MQAVMGFFIFVLVFVSQAKVGRKSEEGLTQMSALHALFAEKVKHQMFVRYDYRKLKEGYQIGFGNKKECGEDKKTAARHRRQSGFKFVDLIFF